MALAETPAEDRVVAGHRGRGHEVGGGGVARVGGGSHIGAPIAGRGLLLLLVLLLLRPLLVLLGEVGEFSVEALNDVGGGGGRWCHQVGHSVMAAAAGRPRGDAGAVRRRAGPLRVGLAATAVLPLHLARLGRCGRLLALLNMQTQS